MKENNGNPIRVSVCMITYNHAKFVTQAITGVLNQKCSFNFELIIGVDQCTDGTLEICKRFQKENPLAIRLLATEKRLGMTENLKRTIQAAESKYIAFCEGDDCWTDSDKLQKEVDYLENNPGCVLVSTGIDCIDENDNRIPQHRILNNQKRNAVLVDVTFPDLLAGNCIYTLTVCADAATLKSLDCPDYGYDYWFWLQMSLKGNIHRMSEITASYRVHSDSVSHIPGFFDYRLHHALRDGLLEFHKSKPLSSVGLMGRIKVLYSMIRFITGKKGGLPDRLHMSACIIKNMYYYARPLLYLPHYILLKNREM